MVSGTVLPTTSRRYSTKLPTDLPPPSPHTTQWPVWVSDGLGDTIHMPTKGSPTKSAVKQSTVSPSPIAREARAKTRGGLHTAETPLLGRPSPPRRGSSARTKGDKHPRAAAAKVVHSVPVTPDREPPDDPILSYKGSQKIRERASERSYLSFLLKEQWSEKLVVHMKMRTLQLAPLSSSRPRRVPTRSHSS